MDPVIEAEGLTKSYGDTPVLRGVDLRIDGGVVALLGANGAGKSTLVSILTTLERADGGRARVLGVDVRDDPAGARRRIRITSQAASVDELLTGRENLVMLGRLLGLGRADARRRAVALLAQLGLDDAGDRLVGRYSGGMRRRLDLAASLIDRPEVLFLDEPSTGLDPVSRARLWDDVRALAAAGTTVLLTTQMLDEAEALAGRVLILRGGRIVADGTARELADRVGGERIVLLDDEGTVVRELGADAGEAGSAGAVAAALAALPPAERRLRVELRRPTLDDAFAALAHDAAVAA
ncbi:ATP-binding cassette domain-containing protein [Agrococcus terreus]|uniref:ABC transporter ATP-binding protein n=1 Tax=Agrococcus terreus TaxID=574649 RepID=UPI00385164BC